MNKIAKIFILTKNGIYASKISMLCFELGWFPKGTPLVISRKKFKNSSLTCYMANFALKITDVLDPPRVEISNWSQRNNVGTVQFLSPCGLGFTNLIDYESRGRMMLYNLVHTSRKWLRTVEEYFAFKGFPKESKCSPSVTS